MSVARCGYFQDRIPGWYDIRFYALMFICVAFKCKLNTGARSWCWGVRKGSMSSDKWKSSLLSDGRLRFIVSECRILFYVVICTTAAVVAYSWNLFSIIGVYSNMASWWILFVTIFLAPPTISLNPITLDDRVPRPAGQAVASIWLVGRITCCHGGNDLSFHHYDTAAFAASDLALSPPPLHPLYSLGAYSSSVRIGGHPELFQNVSAIPYDLYP